MFDPLLNTLLCVEKLVLLKFIKISIFSEGIRFISRATEDLGLRLTDPEAIPMSC